MRSWLLLLVIATSMSARAYGDDAARIGALVEPLIESETLVGCVVGVVRDDRREVYPFGVIRRGGQQRPDGRTIYEIGSITKAFTGTLLGDLVERGIVKLDAPVQDFVPPEVSVPSVDNQALTLLHLANHTSGLPRLADNMQEADQENPYANYSLDKMHAFLNGHKLRRGPGEYEYSNFGMGLLGEILAQRAGSSYESLVIDRICKPLGMDDTRITLSESQRDRLAPPYSRQGEVEHNWDFQAYEGAGALRSTVDDLLKFVSATLVDDESDFAKAIRLAWTKTYGAKGEIGVGLGWHIARDGETRWHNGQTGGYSSAMFIFPKAKVGVVVLTNTSTDVTTTLGEKILQALLGMNPEPIVVRKSIELAPDVLKTYVGKYALSPFFAIEVFEEDGKLMAQATGQGKHQIFPSAEGEFFYKVVDAQISFVKDAEQQGRVTKLILHQNGMDLPGTRIEEK